MLEIFIVLSISRHGEKSFLHNQDACLFVRTALPALFKKQYLHAFALVQDEQILALDLCAAHSCGLVTWNGGFLTKAKCWSPGTALFAFGIEQAIAMGLREYDFTEGNEIYKHSWATSSYAVSELNIYVR